MCHMVVGSKAEAEHLPDCLQALAATLLAEHKTGFSPARASTHIMPIMPKPPQRTLPTWPKPPVPARSRLSRTLQRRDCLQVCQNGQEAPRMSERQLLQRAGCAGHKTRTHVHAAYSQIKCVGVLMQAT
jgi:hypothetical protein